MEPGAGVDAMKDSGNGDGEEDRGVDASEVDCSGYTGAIGDGMVDENN